MSKIANQFFQGQTIQLDGNSYENCDFDGCTMIYRGHATVGLINTRMYGCQWKFEDCAHRTVQTLSDLYRGLGADGHTLIEALFDNIRRGDVGN
jgi:hypothetical protein